METSLSQLKAKFETRHPLIFQNKAALAVAEVLSTLNAYTIKEFAAQHEQEFPETAHYMRIFLETAKKLHRTKLEWKPDQLGEWVSDAVTMSEVEKINLAELKVGEYLTYVNPPRTEMLDRVINMEKLIELFHICLKHHMLMPMVIEFMLGEESRGFLKEKRVGSFTEPYPPYLLPLQQVSAKIEGNTGEFILVEKERRSEVPTIVVSSTSQTRFWLRLIDQHPTAASWFAPLFNDE